MLRGVRGCLRMKPARSRVSTIWCTEGGLTRKYCCMSVSGPAVQAGVEVDKGQILALLGRESFCGATYAGHPI